jgi:hypothetical protein
MFNPNDIAKTDQSAQEEMEFQYPLIQWVNGNPALKNAGGLNYTGGWFTNGSMTDLDDVDGWKPYTLTHPSGGETDGYAAHSIAFSLIRWRRRWEAYTGSGSREVWSWNDYQKAVDEGYRPSGRTHLLVVIKGLEDMGPFTLTLRGSVAKEFMDMGGGILTRFNRSIVAKANQLTTGEGRWTNRYFWIPVGPKNDNKVPIFTTVGSGNQTSKVTLPDLYGIPENRNDVTEELLGKLYVGAELISTLDTAWHESEDWAEQWENTESIKQQEEAWKKSLDEEVNAADQEEEDFRKELNEAVAEDPTAASPDGDIPW